jgi:hypothetical protein
MDDDELTPTETMISATIMVPMHVGFIANSWAKLEHAIVPLMRALLRTSDYAVAKIVSFSCNPPQRRDMLQALAESGFKEDIAQAVAEFCTEFERLRVLRNDIVHGHWDGISSDGKPLLRSVKSRASLKERLDPKEIEWLKQVENEISALTVRAEELEQRIQMLSP